MGGGCERDVAAVSQPEALSPRGPRRGPGTRALQMLLTALKERSARTSPQLPSLWLVLAAHLGSLKGPQEMKEQFLGVGVPRNWTST